VTQRDAAARASRRWRSVWRIHFYSGVFAMPFILIMAISGLVILYSQPIQDATERDMRTVERAGEWRSFDAQERAVEDRYPDTPVLSMTVPADDHHATIFAVDDGSAAGAQVFVDPYTAKVQGETGTGGGVVGLANRVHGFADNEAVTVPLPTVSALWDGDAVMRDYVVGDLVLEIFAVWTIVLVSSGLFLWWPRRSRSGAEARNGRRLLGVRLGKRGRARWRDLHGMSGVLLFSLILLTIVSGLAWSTYWGANFTALANKVSPNTWTDAPTSDAGHVGHLDRLGNQINWNTGDIPIPSSYATDGNGELPAPVSLDSVTEIAEREHMKPGYTVAFPVNETGDDGETAFGSFTITNSWPRKTGEARDVFVDQFTGETLAVQSVYGYGPVSRGMDTLVSTHMGTQLGLFTRIMMTALCLLAIWSVISAGVMFWKRRRPGSLGLPRRPLDVRLAKRLALLAIVIGIVFPEWGITALLVLAVDRFVIRRVRPLRATFGQA
jgi:uncharacterized iron-regulated membrane protein